MAVYFLSQCLLLYESIQNLFAHVLFYELPWTMFSLMLAGSVFYLAYTGIKNISLNFELFVGLIVVSYIVIAIFGGTKADFLSVLPFETINFKAIGKGLIDFNLWFGDFFLVLFMGKFAEHIKLKWTALVYTISMLFVSFLFVEFFNSGAKMIFDFCKVIIDKHGPRLPGSAEEKAAQKDIAAIMENATWNYADVGYFRGGGYSSRFETRAEMPATMIRLNLVKGLGPVLQIAEGWTVELPEDVSDTLWKRTDYTWPCTWFAPRTTGEGAFKTAYDVMNNWGANHGAISYGHIGADLITLCSMLRIPVCMHNVPDEKIFRPAAWNAFGMDKESADYRACQNFGPLFKK